MKNSNINYKVIAFRAAELILIIILLIQYGTIRPNKIFVSKSSCRGVDISHYQGDVDMDKLADQGIDFLYIKATEGVDYIDEYYETNAKNAKKAGLLSGAYHFFIFDSDGISQAEHFIDVIGRQNGRLVPTVDIEYYGDKRKNKPDVDKVRQSLQECLDVLENEYGQKPVIYTTMPFYYRYIKGKFNEYPLWIRNVYFPAGISVGGKWTFWQYDDISKLDGYKGETKYIDMDVFHGSKEEMEKSMVLKSEYAYTFKACGEDKLYGGEQYGFLNLYSDGTGDKHSLYIGQVIALFGEPEHQTEDNEDLFSKAVSATDKDGNVLYLEVYYGPSGPAITGYANKDNNCGEEEYQKAIDELAGYIMDAEPADFEWKSVYGDTGVTLKMGVKDGEPYYITEFPDELMKEFMEE